MPAYSGSKFCQNAKSPQVPTRTFFARNHDAMHRKERDHRAHVSVSIRADPYSKRSRVFPSLDTIAPRRRPRRVDEAKNRRQRGGSADAVLVHRGEGARLGLGGRGAEAARLYALRVTVWLRLNGTPLRIYRRPVPMR